jgi:NAD(P)-dependent dehydrogenase (short-subunit alcohol dehydrogenase family)
MSLVSVVTGANSGIGRATAIHLATQGHVVYGTVRSRDKAGKLEAMAAERGAEVNVVELDVADDASVEKGLASVLAEAGHVDVLVNNAGIGPNGVVEETLPSVFLDVMNVNVVGAIRCIRALLPQMRERRSGTIVNITSVAGLFGSPGQASYTASKWAFEGLSEALAWEVASFGVRVAIVEPGVTKSAIFAKAIDFPHETGAYDMQYRRMMQMYAAGIAHATDPFEVAKVVHDAITADEPVLRHRVSWGSRELADGRTKMSDGDWLGLGAVDDDAEYYERFERTFGLDIRP